MLQIYIILNLLILFLNGIMLLTYDNAPITVNTNSYSSNNLKTIIFKSCFYTPIYQSEQK